ncbi:MAG TPA: sigma-E factor negative regulatory protein [Steroidobacteraceae bacterium]|jgi:Anti sigma-E protein RseA, N-terminal domain|nr:sigma-E factor negative regulatory protein [Steroidobacteraceae bacterium]
MSEQIREQVSAFLDGELPDTETELLLKRLTRDGELRESFGRYALIGEALRGAGSQILTRGFASRVNLAIDGEPAHAPAHAHLTRESRWWRPLAGVTVAASVAAVAIVALQQRAISPHLNAAIPLTAQNVPAPASMKTAAPNQLPLQGGGGPREALSYTVPAVSTDTPLAIAPARLTNYVFAHSKYSSGLGQRGLLADMLIEDEEPLPLPVQRAPQPAPTPDTRVAP